MSRPDNSMPRSVHTKSGVFVLGTNEHVLAGEIWDISAAPTGRYALVIQRLHPERTDTEKRPYAEEKLWLYDARRNTTKLLHRVIEDSTETFNTKIYWFPKTNKALIEWDYHTPISEGRGTFRTIYGLVDAERRSFRLLSTPFEGSWGVEEIPGNSTLLLIGYPPNKPGVRVVTFISPEGRFSSPIYFELLPLARGLTLEGILKGSKEVVLKASYDQPGKDQDKTIKSIWYAIRFNRDTVRLLHEEPTTKEMTDIGELYELNEPAPLPLDLCEESTKLISQGYPSVETTALWLKAMEPGPDKAKAQTLVAVAPYPPYRGTDESACIRYTLLTDLSAVLYLHDGDLYATALTKGIKGQVK